LTIQLTPEVGSLAVYNTHHLATLWKIVRTDAVELYFTDHDTSLVFDGDTYQPAGGFNASARQKQANLQVQNFEVNGILSSSRITFADLDTGKYNEAEVTEYLVDWRYPFAGALLTRTYWIVETTWTGIRWEARVEGLTRWLRPPIGEVFERTCRYELGETRCGVTLGTFTFAGTVVAVSFPGNNDRRAFWSNLIYATGTFDYGTVQWATGNNAGLVSEVKHFTSVGGTVELYLDTPYAIQAGDTFTITTGCYKTKAWCTTTFSNFPNFGGFPFMPGVTEALKTP
jgi:uncharacterized phage protein (TIGR02218 family)